LAAAGGEDNPPRLAQMRSVLPLVYECPISLAKELLLAAVVEALLQSSNAFDCQFEKTGS
jgi:hypothetical protein